jgi:hypothetical protein
MSVLPYGLTGSVLAYRLINGRYSITSPSVSGNRLTVTISLRNYPGVQLVNKERLEEKGYLVDMYESRGWLFHSITYVNIIESVKNPQSVLETSMDKLQKDMREAKFGVTYVPKGSKEPMTSSITLFDDEKTNTD